MNGRPTQEILHVQIHCTETQQRENVRKELRKHAQHTAAGTSKDYTKNTHQDDTLQSRTCMHTPTCMAVYTRRCSLE